jgi:hypothetical protein
MPAALASAGPEFCPPTNAIATTAAERHQQKVLAFFCPPHPTWIRFKSLFEFLNFIQISSQSDYHRKQNLAFFAPTTPERIRISGWRGVFHKT